MNEVCFNNWMNNIVTRKWWLIDAYYASVAAKTWHIWLANRWSDWDVNVYSSTQFWTLPFSTRRGHITDDITFVISSVVTCSAHPKTYSRFVIIACTCIIIHANKEAIGQFPKMWHLALRLQPRGWLMISCSRCRSEAHPLFIVHSSDC